MLRWLPWFPDTASETWSVRRASNAPLEDADVQCVPLCDDQRPRPLHHRPPHPLHCFTTAPDPPTPT